MAGNGMELPEGGAMDRNTPSIKSQSASETTKSVRERRQPDRYGFPAPDRELSSKPKSLTHHSQAAEPCPITTAAAQAATLGHPDQQPEEEEETAVEDGDVEKEEETAAVEGEVEEEEEITHNYVQPEAAEEQPAPQPAPPSQGEVRLDRSRGKRDKRESLPRSKKASSYTYTYASRSSRSSRKSHQMELTPLQAAMIEEKRKLGELHEIQSQIQEEQALDDRAQELDRQAQAALKERERLTRSMTLQRRLRRVQRELEEARLITSFTGEVTTEQPPAPPAQSSVYNSLQGLAPLSMSSRVLDASEPVDLFSVQHAPSGGPQTSAFNPVPVNQPTTTLFQSLPMTLSQPVNTVSQSGTRYPVQGSHPVVQTSSPEQAATPSPPSFHHLVRTAPRPAKTR
ncbi:uncharacterized protein LOC143118547 [Alosa pseudoharengus]|uniref:uncharacterized protein LOC143118547 n=1 Tax=Alosa pseudoharengus TaxID=34774 RepID=UPI003F8BA8CD